MTSFHILTLLFLHEMSASDSPERFFPQLKKPNIIPIKKKIIKEITYFVSVLTVFQCHDLALLGLRCYW